MILVKESVSDFRKDLDGVEFRDGSPAIFLKKNNFTVGVEGPYSITDNYDALVYVADVKLTDDDIEYLEDNGTFDKLSNSYDLLDMYAISMYAFGREFSNLDRALEIADYISSLDNSIDVMEFIARSRFEVLPEGI